jgi:quercetin dioxygenase-like cupin family protein
MTSAHDLSSGAVDLAAAADELLAQARSAPAGRAATTLLPGAGAPLKQTLLALATGATLADHVAPGPATLQVLTGRLTLTVAGDEVPLATGALVAVPRERHGLHAGEDAVALLTVASDR